MTLGELIAKLKLLPPGSRFADGFDRAYSYRGDYSQLAVHPANDCTAGEMLGVAESALGATFEGYKGGEFRMSEYCSVYLAGYGECGEELASGFFEYQWRIAALEAELSRLRSGCSAGVALIAAEIDRLERLNAAAGYAAEAPTGSADKEVREMLGGLAGYLALRPELQAQEWFQQINEWFTKFPERAK